MLSTKKLTFKVRKNGAIKYQFEISNGIKQDCYIKEQGEKVFIICFNKKYSFEREWFFRKETKELFEKIAKQEAKYFE